MFIWIGCKLPEDFEQEIRSACLPVARELGLDITGFSLPQHISLKISFDAGMGYEAVMDAMIELLQKERKFSVEPKKPEQQQNILWVPFCANPTLSRLHNLLDIELDDRFKIPQHPFDKDFRYHTTLCMGEEEKLRKAEEQVRRLSLPAAIEIQTLLLGISESGKSGTYRVVREIHLS